MDSQYDLTYNNRTKEFVGKDGVEFGYVILSQFYYANYPTEYTLTEMFGELTNKLLFDYLRERFPDVDIIGIE